MWSFFKLLRITVVVGAVANYVFTGSLGSSLIFAGFFMCSLAIHRCQGTQAEDFAGGLVNSKVHRCGRLASRRVGPSGSFRGGWYCARHAYEEQRVRE